MYNKQSIREILGSNVKKYRQTLGLTQEQLAELCGFSTRYISDIENGYANLTVDKIEAIAFALNINYHCLFSGVDDRED